MLQRVRGIAGSVLSQSYWGMHGCSFLLVSEGNKTYTVSLSVSVWSVPDDFSRSCLNDSKFGRGSCLKGITFYTISRGQRRGSFSSLVKGVSTVAWALPLWGTRESMWESLYVTSTPHGKSISWNWHHVRCQRIQPQETSFGNQVS